MNKKFSLNVIISVAIGVLGVIGPISWDFYKTKSELEVRALDRAILIGTAAKINGLAINYKGENLEQLSKAIIVVTNTGRTPIVEKDVVKPLTIVFDKYTKVLEVRLESTMPPEVYASTNYFPERNEAIVSAPLMNPGDSLKLSVLAKTERIDFDASARIAGLTSVLVKKEGLNSTAPRSFPWLVIPVGGFSFLLALISLVGFWQAPREFTVRRELRQGRFEIPTLANKEQALIWVESTFYFATSKERETFKALIRTLQDKDNFSATYYNDLLRGAQELVDGMLSNLMMAIGISVVAGVGIWYSVYSLLNA